MQAGASEDKIAQVPEALTSDLFSDREKAALEYAEAMTVTGRRVDDALFARVRTHFSEAQIVELTAAAYGGPGSTAKPRAARRSWSALV